MLRRCCQFLIKQIFGCIEIKILARIIKINKFLQNKINLDINQYMILSKKIIKYEKGVGKEYEIINGELLFEGEYTKGKRNGKGKEYFLNGKILFEGNYSNGKRNGRGKEYYLNGELLFAGYYLNGERSGFGKMYDGKGKLLFEGTYLNGKRSGKGREYNEIEGTIFEGEYLYGVKYGYGQLNMNKTLIIIIVSQM